MTERAVLAGQGRARGPGHDPEEIRVRKDADSIGLARVLERALVDRGRAVMSGIGTQAVYVMVKAAVRARGLVAQRGLETHVVPAFFDTATAEGERITGIRMRLELARRPGGRAGRQGPVPPADGGRP